MDHQHEETPGTSRGAEHHTNVGVHGMVVLGGHKTGTAFRSPVYISHLPMFMAPHDFQVIARVSGQAAGSYGDFVAHFGPFELYTFAPVPFSIDDLDPATGDGPSRASIRGSLFRGHFEREGTQISSGVDFEVERVLHFRHLDVVSDDSAHDRLRYILFGEPDAAFLAHFITTPPTFDQILAVELASPGGLSAEDLHSGVLITVPDRADLVESRLHEDEMTSASVHTDTPDAGGSVELTVVHEVYLETRDLAGAM